MLGPALVQCPVGSRQAMRARGRKGAIAYPASDRIDREALALEAIDEQEADGLAPGGQDRDRVVQMRCGNLEHRLSHPAVDDDHATARRARASR